MWNDDLAGLLHESGDDAFYRLKYYESVDSTNECVKREAAEGAEEGLLIVGEEQTAGKGRSGRSWVSPKGEAVYFSFLLRPDLRPENVSALTLVMGLSVAQAVRETLALDVRIKWPNDIVIGGKKICGILTEAAAREGRIEWIVIGTGINVNNTSFDETIRDRATSLLMEAGRTVSRAGILAAVLGFFRKNYVRYMEYGNMSNLIGDYNRLLVSRGEKVRIEDPAGPYTAVSYGIDELGRLLVKRDDGGEERVAAGEVSVRGIYGYV